MSAYREPNVPHEHMPPRMALHSNPPRLQVALKTRDIAPNIITHCNYGTPQKTPQTNYNSLRDGMQTVGYGRSQRSNPKHAIIPIVEPTIVIFHQKIRSYASLHCKPSVPSTMDTYLSSRSTLSIYDRESRIRRK